MRSEAKWMLNSKVLQKIIQAGLVLEKALKCSSQKLTFEASEIFKLLEESVNEDKTRIKHKFTFVNLIIKAYVIENQFVLYPTSTTLRFTVHSINLNINIKL